ncbi:dethiobiotin synthase [Deinococcus hopiensis]|uniref:ATP-dependent dethiobiotin synthetase BioD n=1 Tax=Deinococcus hopiensis KR-140 TaxID=695939 RepID=A0A1W1VQJ6_9DEIO|nr:dethiobiotin synthase [Deinococcus hopiensis]SMB95543.1 malonyl-CoA O-methyltransferase [Deinococcus hopiensis KR-140]
MLRGVFVTGTDTGVGKTVVSAALCLAWGAAYWKPLQTGAVDGDDDTAAVTHLAALSPEQVFAPGRVYGEPAAPERAATLEGTEVRISSLTPPQTSAPLVVEGAGGLLVPINADETMADLMAALGLPAVVVARSTLGTINHTLLTLEALRSRGLPLLGVVMSGPPSAPNREAIERHGGVRVLAEFPRLDEVTPAEVARLAGLLPDLKVTA